MRIEEFIALPRLLKYRSIRGRVYGAFPQIKARRSSMVERRFRTRLSAPKKRAGDCRRYILVVPSIRDGIGHSLSEWNAGFMAAQAIGGRMVSIPLPARWDALFQFNQLALSYADFRLEVARFEKVHVPYFPFGQSGEPYADLLQQLETFPLEKDTLFVLCDGQNAFDHSASAKVLSKHYRKSAKFQELAVRFQRTREEEGKKRLALHIRQGDILSGHAHWQARFVDFEWYLEQVHSIIGDRPGDWIVDVFTQGDISPFMQQLDACGYAHEDGSTLGDLETFFRISQADAIIGSRSGFSYFAALFSCANPRIFPEDFWHGT